MWVNNPFLINLSLLLIHFVTPDHVTCNNLFLAAILDYTHSFRNLSTKFKKMKKFKFPFDTRSSDQVSTEYKDHVEKFSNSDDFWEINEEEEPPTVQGKVD